MEAHIIADKQRTRLVGKVEFESPPAQTRQKNLENHISDLNKNVGSLQKTMQNFVSSNNNQQNRRTDGNITIVVKIIVIGHKCIIVVGIHRIGEIIQGKTTSKTTRLHLTIKIILIGSETSASRIRGPDSG